MKLQQAISLLTLLFALAQSNTSADGPAATSSSVDTPSNQRRDPNEAMLHSLKQVELTSSMLKRIPHDKQNLRQRRETIEDAGATLKSLQTDISNVETGGLHLFEAAKKEGKKFLDSGIEEVAKVLDLMQKAELDSSDIQEMVTAKTKRRGRRLSDESEGTSSSFESDATSKSSHSPHARFASFFSSDPMAASMHKKASQMHDAILNQDHNHMHRVLKSHHKKVDRAQQRRKLEEAEADVDPLEHDKGRQCQILTECASTMSLYDLFIFFYSDDIDVKAGTIDKDILRFDEEDLFQKHLHIKTLSNNLNKRYKKAEDPLLKLGLDEDCNNLLELFHRNIEMGSVPHWQGATVSQVCLAEGSAEFIGLGEVAQAVGGSVATKIAEEQLNCAWELYNSKNRTEDVRYRREPFAFADEKFHERGSRLTIQDLLVPIGINFDVRDEHGKMLTDDERNSHKRFYDYEAFVSPDLRGFPPKERREKVKEAWDHVQSGFDLAFGEKQSVGFVCGVKEQVLRGGSYPGACCLDAPFENDGDEWGRKFDCTKECKHPGPFLSGLSEEACSAHGGNWCQAPANCKVLKECVDYEIASAEERGFMPYATYLKGGVIANPRDAHDCGRSREYFGFDETYNNDKDVCMNVHQLRNTRNFQDLDQFFNQGSKGSDEENEAIPSAEIKQDLFNERLREPTRDRSSTDPVAQGTAWDATNFALSQAFDGVSRVHSIFADFECPDDGWGITWTVCSTFKNVLTVLFNTILGIFEVVLNISEFTFGELCNPSAIDHFEVWENTDAIFNNMEITFNYIDHVWNGVSEHHRQLAKAQSEIGEIMSDRLSRIDETLAYIVEKLDAMPAPKVTHRPTPLPTAHPTTSPTLTPGNTRAPTATPSAAPSMENFCDPIVDMQNILASDWFFDDWSCNPNFPCVATYDTEDGTFWMGYRGNGFGPGKVYGVSKVFSTTSLADTRALLCGLEINVNWDDGKEKTLQLVDGSIRLLDGEEKEFSRCKPKYSLEDIQTSNWIQSEWGCTEEDPCIEATVDEEGKLWMGNPKSHSGFGPDLRFGKVGYLYTASEAETHKLICGLPAIAMLSSLESDAEVAYDIDPIPSSELRTEQIQMLSAETISHGDLTMTRACTPKYTLGDIVDSDWFLSNWDCGADNPCTAKTDSDGRVYIGKAGIGFGPENDFGHWTFFKSSSAAHTRNLLCGKPANFDRQYSIEYIVVSGDKVVDGFPTITGAKSELGKIKSGSRLIAQVKDGKLIRDPHRVAGKDQEPHNGFNKHWTGWSDINRMMNIAERYLHRELNLKFLVVAGGHVQGHYAELDDAKDALKQFTKGSRLIAEFKEGEVLEDPHKIAGIDQTQQNGFNKWWADSHDMTNMIKVAKDYMVIQRGVRTVKMDDNGITEVKKDGSTGFMFERACEPIYSLEDFMTYEWSYPNWDDGRGLVSRIADDGKLWLGRPGKGRGPDSSYGKWWAFNTNNSAETRKLVCGLPSKITWDNGVVVQISLVSGNKMTFKYTNGKTYVLKRTSVEAELPKLRMYGPQEGTGRVGSWQQATGFCKEKGLQLAEHSDYCNAGRQVFGGLKNGNQWAPIRDNYNSWVQIGDIGFSHSKHDLCKRHDDRDMWGENPWWGEQNSLNHESWEANYILCKKTDYRLFTPKDGTAKITNWEDSVKFCEEHELALASRSDYCSDKKIFGGVKGHDEWLPFIDYPNGWVHGGTKHGECTIHSNSHVGEPKWGTDNTHQSWEANYVLCKAG